MSKFWGKITAWRRKRPEKGLLSSSVIKELKRISELHPDPEFNMFILRGKNIEEGKLIPVDDLEA